jgi:RNA polymerase sigma-70 factor (ECF subfamily)
MDQEPDPETLRRLEAALLKLPRMEREIFLAVRLDHMDYRKIARRTRLSVKQVEKKMGRAVYLLSRALDEDGGP